ncbi:IgGFc-binding protein [Sandaracinus amylolyticus]|uniref:Hemagglutinin/hemolysin-related protein n=1 Tax=Sandaracinus amylolyticus TaxID=927083 RepID=A0A0F6SE53_9BACT|nr:IgGFc-binding protein [Sandaracinus amylolyticus]AKF04594.1 Hemagglutinin/hemolysin-related protein [Sandaracinus amylolyticus]
MRRLAALLPIALSLVTSACIVEEGPLLPMRDAGVDAPMPDAGPIDGGFSCTPDAPGCFGYVHYVCGDDGASREDEQVCEGGCDPAMGCIECVPGSFRCDGTVSTRCDEDHRWQPVRDCSEWSSVCGGSGICDDACGLAEAVRSNVGCEYWPVPLANIRELNSRAYDFRVVVANPGATRATVSISRAGRTIETTQVTPGGVAEISLPWIEGVSFPFATNDWESVVTANGAYRLTSSVPVIVTQFNPFHYASASADYSFTNDASLLLPSHVLGREHVGTSYVPFSISDDFDPTDEHPAESARYPGYLAVIGVSAEPTAVEIEVAGDVAADAGGRWEATARGGTIRFTLARGEVAQIAAAVPPVCAPDRPGFRDAEPDEPRVTAYCREEQFDLTGSRVHSDRPVAVFGGHTCTNIPYDIVACDHLETQLAPVETWGKRFSTMPMRDPDTAIANLLRITAAHDGTTVTLDPPPRSGGEVALAAGEHVEIEFDRAMTITSSLPVQVAQLLVGQNITDPPLERGDPGMTTLVPEEQYRRDYVFAMPSSYTPLARGQSYLLVSREPGAEITLDGRTLEAEWTRVGDRELAIVPVPAGNHRLTAASPVGLIAYGLGLYTSYAYPAGLDLRVIPI